MKNNVSTDDGRQFKDAIAGEILVCYREAAALYRKISEPESRQTLLALQHGFEVALKHLLPLDEQSEKTWASCRGQFD